MRLHEQVGPAATTVSAVADRAGVTRLTVYRHFPDDEALVGACAAHWGALHPPPDPASWLSIDDPERRLRAALLDLYAWARPAAPMMTKIYQDLHVMPHFVGDSLSRQEQDRVTLLAAGFPAAGPKVHRVRTALTHAIAFRTWQSLCLVGELRDDEAVELMVAAVLAAVHTPVRRPKRQPRPQGPPPPGPVPL
ncbi:MAG: TetR/AcrR family transcriptional regulator [Actinomycetota bacterium]|nr:TetR/AcrR family transcriptional regulator [Actinomycetota bacterium]